MNRKKFFLAALVLNTVMLAFAVCVYNLHATQTHGGESKDSRPKALTGESGKFGPVIETVLLAANTNGRAQILDVETGHGLPEPLPEAFGFRANAIMGWIRGKGLDISCSVWPNGGAACVTYEMTLLPVDHVDEVVKVADATPVTAKIRWSLRGCRRTTRASAQCRR